MIFMAGTLAVIVAMVLVVIRVVRGPTLFDRVLAGNTIGSLAIIFLSVLGFLNGRPEWLDLGITYGVLNLIGTLAILKFFRHGDLAHDAEEDDA
jgi:multicomponent Na+:H+ antiporter subunit F